MSLWYQVLFKINFRDFTNFVTFFHEIVTIQFSKCQHLTEPNLNLLLNYFVPKTIPKPKNMIPINNLKTTKSTAEKL